MATVTTASNGGNLFVWVAGLFEQLATVPASALPNALRIVLVDDNARDGVSVDGWSLNFSGTGFSYAAGEPIAGTVNAITLRDADHRLLIRFAAVARDLGDFWHLLNGRGFVSGSDAYKYLFSGNDTVDAGPGGFEFFLWTGNDRFTGGSGADFVDPGAGRDTVNGGGAYDTLAYNQATYDTAATRGVVVDAVTGIAIDPYGQRDSFANFEEYQGTRFHDVLRGSAKDESFHGNRGRDTIDGRGGIDAIDFGSEHNHGGRFGITANLASGRVVDTFGTRDQVSNIESIRGSIFDDAIIGTSGGNDLAGLAGADTIDGAGGLDDLARYDLDAGRGGSGAISVSLHMSVHRGVIVGTATDGFGNIDILRSIERACGSDATGDRLTGSSAANRLEGRGGNDVLSGLAGDDVLAGEDGLDTLTGGAGFDGFDFWARTHAGDTITDFASGTDHLGFRVTAFGDITALTAENFVQNLSGQAATEEHRFIFETDAGRLYFDGNGSERGGRFLVATLQDVSSLSPSDFDFF